MHNIRTWALDIETASEGKRATDYTNGKSYYAAKNIKDPDKIAASIEAQKKKAGETHALHWWTGKVISVAIVEVHGDDYQVFDLDYYNSEKELLEDLAVYIGVRDTIITKSGDTFDVPFLVGRMMLHKIKLPAWLTQTSLHRDVDKFFGWSASSGQRSTLEAYAHGLGIEGKAGGLKGSEVPGLYARIKVLEIEGKIAEAKLLWKELSEYNLQDSRITAEIARRYMGVE